MKLRRMSILFLLPLLGALGVPRPDQAQVSSLKIETADAPGSPVQVTAVPLAGSYPADGSLAISVNVKNNAAVPLRRIGLQAIVYSAEGRMSGAYSYYSSFPLAPAEERHFLRRTTMLRVKPGERVVIRLLAALGKNLHWAADPIAAVAVEESFARLSSTGAQLQPANASFTCKDTCPCSVSAGLCRWGGVEVEMSCLCTQSR